MIDRLIGIVDRIIDIFVLWLGDLFMRIPSRELTDEQKAQVYNLTESIIKDPLSIFPTKKGTPDE